jgi:NitT/TauT family transport system ATP-binding protein
MMSFLMVKAVSKVFLGERKEEVVALDNLNFAAEEGEFLCVVGPTGCGKTTLLRLIAGLDQPDSGEITLGDTTINSLNRKSTLVFQQYSLFPWRNVLSNVAFSLEMKKLPRKARYEKARTYIARVGLAGFEKAYPYELSGGMQQRVAIARAIAHNPQILLLDEPFGALDDRMRNMLQTELLSIWQQERKTVVFVTHNIDEAIYLGDRILIMKDRPGSIDLEIPVTFSRPRNRRSDEFINLHLKIRERLDSIITNGT